MNELERLGKRLSESGKTDKLKSIADSADGKALSNMLDAAEVERAAKSGDMAALQGILSRVLNTDEGRRLAENLKKAME